jgi:hypothetical protein
MRQVARMLCGRIHRLRCTDDGPQSIPHDQLHPPQFSSAQWCPQRFIVFGTFRRIRPPVHDLVSPAFPYARCHQQCALAGRLGKGSPIPQVNSVPHDVTKAPQRDRSPPPLLDLLLRLLQQDSDRGGRERPAKKRRTQPTTWCWLSPPRVNVNSS